MDRIRCMLVLAVALGSAGCRPPTMPPAKVFQGDKDLSALAVIEGESDHSTNLLSGPDHVMITKIDDKSTEDGFRKYVFQEMEAPEKVIVEPGKHYLSVKWQYAQLSAKAKLWLDAEAGKTYVVHKMAVGGGKVKFWITEGQSGKIVGGIDVR